MVWAGIWHSGITATVVIRGKADSYFRVTSPASDGVKRNAFAAVERVRKKLRLRSMRRRSMKAFASHACRRNATASTRRGSMNQPLYLHASLNKKWDWAQLTAFHVGLTADSYSRITSLASEGVKRNAFAAV